MSRICTLIFIKLYHFGSIQFIFVLFCLILLYIVFDSLIYLPIIYQLIGIKYIFIFFSISYCLQILIYDHFDVRLLKIDWLYFLYLFVCRLVILLESMYETFPKNGSYHNLFTAIFFKFLINLYGFSILT